MTEPMLGAGCKIPAKLKIICNRLEISLSNVSNLEIASVNMTFEWVAATSGCADNGRGRWLQQEEGRWRQHVVQLNLKTLVSLRIVSRSRPLCTARLPLVPHLPPSFRALMARHNSSRLVRSSSGMSVAGRNCKTDGMVSVRTHVC